MVRNQASPANAKNMRSAFPNLDLYQFLFEPALHCLKAMVFGGLRL
jgi:hypothetical protein